MVFDNLWGIWNVVLIGWFILWIRVIEVFEKVMFVSVEFSIIDFFVVLFVGFVKIVCRLGVINVMVDNVCVLL